MRQKLCLEGRGGPGYHPPIWVPAIESLMDPQWIKNAIQLWKPFPMSQNSLETSFIPSHLAIDVHNSFSRSESGTCTWMHPHWSNSAMEAFSHGQSPMSQKKSWNILLPSHIVHDVHNDLFRSETGGGSWMEQTLSSAMKALHIYRILMSQQKHPHSFSYSYWCS